MTFQVGGRAHAKVQAEENLWQTGGGPGSGGEWSVWSQVSGSAVGTLERFPAGANKIHAAFPEDHSGGPDGAECRGCGRLVLGFWPGPQVGREVEDLSWRWGAGRGGVGLSAGCAALSMLGTPSGVPASCCLGASPDQRIDERLAHLCLLFFQGHSVHTFDLKLVWVEPGQDG